MILTSCFSACGPSEYYKIIFLLFLPSYLKGNSFGRSELIQKPVVASECPAVTRVAPVSSILMHFSASLVNLAWKLLVETIVCASSWVMIRKNPELCVHLIFSKVWLSCWEHWQSPLSPHGCNVLFSCLPFLCSKVHGSSKSWDEHGNLLGLVSFLWFLLCLHSLLCQQDVFILCLVTRVECAHHTKLPWVDSMWQ